MSWFDFNSGESDFTCTNDQLGRLAKWDAIDRHRLVPFAYFGIHDDQDLSKLPFRRGTGYDIEALTNVYTGNDSWARTVIQEVINRIGSIHEIRALGFCVSIVHSQFMAKRFNEVGIKSLAIWSDTPAEERKAALQKLANKDVNVIFSVDLFNEGVDVPSVDTLFMLRPTESPTLFLQQLGLGLNRSLCLVCGCLREKNRRIGGLMDLGQPHSAALLHWREVRNSLTLVYPFPL